jgi:hypothetical protein
MENNHNGESKAEADKIHLKQEIMTQICNYAIYHSSKTHSALLYFGHTICTRFCAILSIMLVTVYHINTFYLY